jgi:hypothetical protein
MWSHKGFRKSSCPVSGCNRSGAGLAARLRGATGAAGTGFAVVALGAVAALASAAIVVRFARTVVTPPRRRPEDVRILAVGASTITLSATLDSLTPGRYSLWFDRDAGHARVGEILTYDTETVTRALLGVDFGDLAGARRGRFSGWFYLHPEDLGVDASEVSVVTELGPAPAGLVAAAEPTTTTTPSGPVTPAFTG